MKAPASNKRATFTGSPRLSGRMAATRNSIPAARKSHAIVFGFIISAMRLSQPSQSSVEDAAHD